MSTAEQRYDTLSTDREPFLIRARSCARVTIPMLMPDNGHTQSTEYYTPYQSIGARGVNNLAAKLLLSMFPPNEPFFRLSVDDFTLVELTKDPNSRAVVEEGLAKVERSVRNEIETSALRPPVFEATKQLIVSGNALIYLPKGRGAKVYRLDRYVIQRDTMGNLLEAIVKEEISFSALPNDVQDAVKDGLNDAQRSSTEDIPVFTRFWLDGNKIRMHQEISGKIVPGTEGDWLASKSPIIALRWMAIDGEDYGRSYVEEYLGDLVSLEGLCKAIVEAAAAASKVVFMVNPNGVTREKDIAESENLDVITGIAEEVTVLQVEKRADMQVANQVIQDIVSRLSAAFLLNQSVTRQAERVTAEEIRFMIGELEAALGGVYALLSQELQLPLVRRLMDRMAREKRLPALPDKVIEPTITTGLEALGRGQDLNKYQMFMGVLQPLGPEGLKYLNLSDFITRCGTALGIDMGGLVKDANQLAQEAQQAQQMQQGNMMNEQMAKSLPAIAGHLTKGVVDGTLQQGAGVAPSTPMATPQ